MFITRNETYQINVKALEILGKCNSYCKAVEYLSELTDEEGVREIVEALAEKAMEHAKELSYVNALPNCVYLANLAAEAATKNAKKAVETAYGCDVYLQPAS